VKLPVVSLHGGLGDERGLVYVRQVLNY